MALRHRWLTRRPAAPAAPPQGPEPPDPLQDYRKQLVEAAHKSQENFDKTVLALSGGALGVSFTFLKEVVGTAPIKGPEFLVGAWIAWALSAFAVLLSYYLSHMALRVAIRQVDDGTIYKSRPGGVYARFTAVLNISGATLFVLGVLAITLFASSNLMPRAAKSVVSIAPQVMAASSATFDPAMVILSQHRRPPRPPPPRS